MDLESLNCLKWHNLSMQAGAYANISKWKMKLQICLTTAVQEISKGTSTISSDLSRLKAVQIQPTKAYIG